MKRSILSAAVAVMAVALFTGFAAAKDAKTVSGTSGCATCEGVTGDGHAIMLTDADGVRWVLTGEGDAYKKAHDVRKSGKKLTATLSSEPETKKDAEGKEYMAAKVSDIKIEA